MRCILTRLEKNPILKALKAQHKKKCGCDECLRNKISYLLNFLKCLFCSYYDEKARIYDELITLLEHRRITLEQKVISNSYLQFLLISRSKHTQPKKLSNCATMLPLIRGLSFKICMLNPTSYASVQDLWKAKNSSTN